MVTPGSVHEPLPVRDVVLGRSTHARRLLPNKVRRMIGPWCLVTHYGPDDVRRDGGLMVPPHPYAGLQALTWLFEGVVEHTDSLGNRVLVNAGELSLLTAGTGVCRAETSPAQGPRVLHGVQLWVAMPRAARTTAGPALSHVTEPPTYAEQGTTLRVLAGELAGEASPVPTYSPLVGAEVTMEPGATATLPLEERFEHGVLVVRGEVTVDGEPVGREEMVYLGSGREGLDLATVDEAAGPAALLLLGGEPFREELVLWWNFLGGDHDEVVRHHEAWNAAGTAGPSQHHGQVPGFGSRMPAPPMPNGRLRPWTPGS